MTPHAALAAAPVLPSFASLLDEADDGEFLELLGRYREVGGLANRAEVEALVAARGARRRARVPVAGQLVGAAVPVLSS